MTDHASNPSAFPSGLKATNIGSNGGRYEGTYVDEYASAEGGMTLRDYFAGKALQSGWLRNLPNYDGGWDTDEMARGCYQIADSMLKAREA